MKDIGIYDIRSDYKSVLVLRDYDVNEMINIIKGEYEESNCKNCKSTLKFLI